MSCCCYEEVSNDVIRAAALKRHSPEGGKKAASKKPKTSGPSVEAPAAAMRSLVPRIAVVPSRDADPGDEEVEVVLATFAVSAPSATVSASPAAVMVMSSLGPSSGVPRKASTVLGVIMALSSSSGPRVSGGSSACGGVGTSSSPQKVGTSWKPSGHQTSMSWCAELMADGFIRSAPTRVTRRCTTPRSLESYLGSCCTFGI